MSDNVVELPALPTGKELEDFVAAYFQVSGHYVERNVIEREEEDVLELDIISTRYKADDAPAVLLTEVKSGNWGFSDLFKLSGWLGYLRLPRAAFVVTKGKENMDMVASKADRMGIHVIEIGDIADAHSCLSPITESSSHDPLGVKVWRYYYWLDREIMKRLTRLKNDTNARRYHTLANYYRKINSDIFFCETGPERMNVLCESYRAHPDLSAKVVHEALGRSPSLTPVRIDSGCFESTFYRHNFTDLTISAYIEHRARIALLKCGVDHVIRCRNTQLRGDAPTEQIPTCEDEAELSAYLNLPSKFRGGLERISNAEYLHLYPQFWQCFLFAYGGFILMDIKDEEYSSLSRHTGIPVSSIDDAIRSYGELFPTGGGWFTSNGMSNITMIKLLPSPIKGIGVYNRRVRYGWNPDFDNTPLTGEHTLDDLIQWNNSAYDILEASR